MIQKGSLEGIQVLDLSRLLPGPFCSMVLADHGARVIAIEDNRFRKEKIFLTGLTRNKEHMALDLKTAEGLAVFFRLAEKADIILEGFRPGVVKKLGVDYESIKKVNSGVIYCSITGYGQNGPMTMRAGHDINYIGRAGVLDLIGSPDGPPSIPGVQLADIAGGGMNAVIGILLALYARQTTGRGQYIDISMTDGMIHFLHIPLHLQQLTGKSPERSNTLLSHHYAFYNTYETSDGRHIAVGALEHKFWKKLCETVGADEYISLQFDEERQQEIITYFRGLFKNKTLQEWKMILDKADVCCGPVQCTEEVLDDPLFQTREMVLEIEGKDGKKELALGIPVKLSDTPGSIRTPPVEFGADGPAILEELGYSKMEIDRFINNDII